MFAGLLELAILMLELAFVLIRDPDITLLSIVVFGVLAVVLLKGGLGLELCDSLRRNGILNLLPEDILS